MAKLERFGHTQGTTVGGIMYYGAQQGNRSLGCVNVRLYLCVCMRVYESVCVRARVCVLH